jgi:hypothetical protein
MPLDTLGKLKDAVIDAVKDITSLDVTTFTGSLEIDFDGASVEIDPEKIFAHLQGPAKGTLKVLAHTHKDFDADTLLFVRENLTEDQTALLAAHRDAVEAAIEQRQAAITVLRSLL